MNYLQEKISMRFTRPNYRVFSTILLGFLFFGLKDFAEIVSSDLPRVVAFIGLLFIFVSPLYYKYKITNPLKGLVKFLFNVYLIWLIFIIFRPFFLGQQFSNDSIHPYAIYGIASYLLPFVVVYGTNIISLSNLFKIIYVFSIIGFVFFVINFNTMQSIVISGIGMSIDGEIGIGELASNYYYWFSISSLSLLCYEFVPNKYKRFAVFTSLFTFFLMIYFARRGTIFISALYFIGMFYLYLEQSKSKKRFFKFILLIVVMILAYNVVLSYSSSTFSLLFSRLTDDSRSSVDEALINYLNKENAWLIGKGIEGVYNHPDFILPRYVHETGYLYLILKGGIVYLSFYVFLLFHAFYLGFFKTKNRLTKALAIYVFIHIIYLIPFGLPSFSLEYFFVWIAFAICESKWYRIMTNEQIKLYLINYK